MTHLVNAAKRGRDFGRSGAVCTAVSVCEGDGLHFTVGESGNCIINGLPAALQRRRGRTVTHCNYVVRTKRRIAVRTLIGAAHERKMHRRLGKGDACRRPLLAPICSAVFVIRVPVLAVTEIAVVVAIYRVLASIAGPATANAVLIRTLLRLTNNRRAAEETATPFICHCLTVRSVAPIVRVAILA